MQVAISRKDISFIPDSTRVIARFLYTNDERAINTIRLVLSMSKDDVTLSLNSILNDYSMRHRNISRIFEKHFDKIVHLFKQLNINPDTLTH